MSRAVSVNKKVGNVKRAKVVHNGRYIDIREVSKRFKRAVAITFNTLVVAFLIWFIASWVDAAVHNLEPISETNTGVADWNAIVMLLEYTE